VGSCDLVNLGWLSSEFQESSQPCTLQQKGEGSGVVPEHRMVQKRIGQYVWDAGRCFCCVVQLLLLVPSNITLLLRSISNLFSKEKI